MLLASGCRSEPARSAAANSTTAVADSFAERRQAMVERQIEARGIKSPAVLGAMRKVPRHRFVRPGAENLAYEDHPLQIGSGQTISQPYIVARSEERRVGNEIRAGSKQYGYTAST